MTGPSKGIVDTIARTLSVPHIGYTATDLDDSVDYALGLNADSPASTNPLTLAIAKANAIAQYLRSAAAGNQHPLKFDGQKNDGKSVGGGGWFTAFENMKTYVQYQYDQSFRYSFYDNNNPF